MYDLRVRLASQEDEARRKQQRLQPGPNRWRAGYGDVAPLALVPQPTQGRHEGGLAAFHAETERLEASMRQGQASAADFFLHGLIHYECGYLPIALRDFDQAIGLPGEPSDQYYSLRGLAHYGLGEYREAWKDLDGLLRQTVQPAASDA